MKLCKKCATFKSNTEFSKYKPSKDGLQYYCKLCDNAKKRQYYIDNKEAMDKKNKKWQEENYKKHLKHQDKYHLKKRFERLTIQNELEEQGEIT